MKSKRRLTTVYVASPYSYKGNYPFMSIYVRWTRFIQILFFHAYFDSYYQVQCFGPILESHMVVFFAKLMKLPIGKSSGTWADFEQGDLAMVSALDELWVVMMDGWNESTGVTAEILHAKKLKKPVRYFCPKRMELYDTPTSNMPALQKSVREVSDE